MRVLVVDDSERLQRSLSLALKKRGYVVDVVGDGQEAVWLASENPYDAILLDVMLPGLDGFAVLRTLRGAEVQSPILMLTARGEVSDRVAGLEAGADDYLSKPFALPELLARVDSLVRRRYVKKNPRLSIGALEIDTAARQVSWEGQAVLLTPREYRLIEYLARRRGEVVSKSEIEAHLYSEDKDLFSNTIESTVSALRKKIWGSETEPLLQTRRGLGYVLEAA